jgi:hypothetical protein
MRIDARLAEIGDFGGFFAMAVGGDDHGWRPVAQCYAEGYADLIATTAERYRTADLRIAASLAQFSLASRLWSPVLACTLVFGIVPDLADLHRAPDSAELRVVEPNGTRVDERDMAAMLYDVVVQQHLEPYMAGLRVKVASGLLYGNAASAMVAAARALYGVRPELRDSATRLARALLETGRLAGTGTVRYNLAYRRRSCCLYYRTSGGSKCGDCGLR